MKRWRTILWALLLLLPGGLWVMGAVALVNLVRRQLASRAAAAPSLATESPRVVPAPLEDCPPPLRDAAASTWL